ncbi:MAG: hypothetical protein K6E49_04035 [Lachnospiraceae bacterium]|nr:hypothetical protein [Lachnospiraceae bacterium]
MKIYADCSNYATDTCPCVLAESGHCVVCSMCAGEDFCSCTNTVSFCIMQELINNGGRAKDQHHMTRCTITYERVYDDAVKVIRLAVPSVSIDDFKRIGAFVFIRSKENTFYDVPISVLYDEKYNDSIELLIRLQGVKTECFRELEKGDSVFLRGPYMNGILGLRALASLHDNEAVVLCRGIGLFPSLHVISALQRNNNHVKVCIDSGSINDSLLEAAKELFKYEIDEVSIYDPDGEISRETYDIIDEALSCNTGLIHFGLSNYLIKRLIGYVESKKAEKVNLSCINNSHMCCGEGICGACTINTDSTKIVHMCKEQIDLYEYAKLPV